MDKSTTSTIEAIMKLKAIFYLLSTIAIVIMAISIYANGGRVDTAMLKSDYTTYCRNAELVVDSCSDWANNVVSAWSDQAQECRDLYQGDTDLWGICITGFMIDNLAEAFIGNGD